MYLRYGEYDIYIMMLHVKNEESCVRFTHNGPVTLLCLLLFGVNQFLAILLDVSMPPFRPLQSWRQEKEW